MIKTMVAGFGWKITDRMMSTMIKGSESPASTMRIMTESSGPPTKPEIAPYSAPKTTATIAAAIPTSSEVCPPIISLPSWSYPSSLQPSRCSPDGLHR